MSFILDALRKSEHERQRQTGPDIAHVRAVPPPTGLPIWAIAIGALLLINLIIVLVLVLRGGDETAPTAAIPAAQPIAPAVASPPAPVAATPPVQAPAVVAPVATNPAPARVEMPQEEVPAPSSSHEPLTAYTPPRSVNEPTAIEEPTLTRHEPTERLPTIHELNFSGVNALPPLHLDIHVYAKKPTERFVFINMKKYKEGARMNEGLTVERITPDGVVLDRDGTRFILPRQ